MAATSKARHIHVVSAGYLRQFAIDGHVCRHDVATGERARQGVKQVGWRWDHWGPDPIFARRVEDRLNQLEDRAPRILRELLLRWPLGREDRSRAQPVRRAPLAPAFGVILRTLTDETIAERRELWRRWPRTFERAARWLQGHRSYTNAALGQISRIASALSSMHWCIVVFDTDTLVTSDHPVVAIPFGPYSLSPASVTPSTGVINTVEVRFAVNAQTLLLMTWLEASDSATPLPGDFRAACNTNSAVTAQALQEWFYRPSTTPHFVVPPWLERDISPIAPRLLAGYSLAAAQASRRRHETGRLMCEITEKQLPRTAIRWVTRVNPG